jgi:hypothetical protein
MDLLSEIERPDPAEQDKRERRFRLVASVGIVGLSLVGVTTLATGALFTDQDTVAGAITAGTVVLDADAPTTIDTTTLPGGMAPGDTLTRVIDVANGGSLGLSYGATVAATDVAGGTLANALTLEWDFQPTATACTPLTALSNSGPINGVLAAAGSQVLGAGSAEQLCVRVLFTDGGPPANPVAAAGVGDNAYQGDVANLTFTFTAQQRAAVKG